MKRLVVKIGSNILAGGKEGLDTARMSSIADDIAHSMKLGYQIVLVSSGAVAAGMGKLGLRERPRDVMIKQAVAAVGQSSLMWAYERCFSEYGLKVAQVLLTREDLADRKRFINSKNTFLTLLSFGVVPIVNENDTVATDEIKFGDNDTLASLVAILIEAERLVILSDVEGLYGRDPRIHRDAQILRSVSEITPAIEKIAGGAGSSVGTGGMYSKILAAKRATSHGIGVTIMTGKRKGLLPSLLEGAEEGTFFPPAGSRLSLRKRWIAHGSHAKGTLILDPGAAKAIVERGKSLLPSGITTAEGEFEVGDAVYCSDRMGTRIAKGLMNYSSSDLSRIIGKKTSEIEKILGFKYSDEAIHRDNLVLL